jgi:hypothetical protein
VLDKPTPAARAGNALLTWQCVTFTVVMTRHTPDPGDPVEPLLAGFNAAVDEHTVIIRRYPCKVPRLFLSKILINHCNNGGQSRQFSSMATA